MSSTTDRAASPPMTPTPASDPPDRASGAPTVLIVEDSEGDAALLTDVLTRRSTVDFRPHVRWVDRLARALEVLARERVDAVLLDLSLPDARNLQGLHAIIAAAPDVPVVVMTGIADDRLALRAVHDGAQDYLVKGQDAGRLVRRALGYAIERQQRLRERAQLLEREHAAREAAERAAGVRDDVLAVVSHDLRTPLSTIAMCAHALVEPGADVAGLAGVIAQSTQWSLRIIQDLLDVTSLDAGRLAIVAEPTSPQHVVEVLDAMFRPLADAKHVQLRIEAGPLPRTIDVDPDRIVQAVGNLLANAVRFAPRGGHVTLAVAAGDDGMLRLRVDDDGPGIDPAHLPRLFDRFWQARSSRRAGAGLGLAIAKGLVEAHGGTLTVASTPGAGASFTCAIPVTAGAAPPTATE